MGFDYSFRSIDGNKAVAEAVSFLSKQSLGYPKYADWVGRAEAELRLGVKKGVVAYNNLRIAGDVICQPHKSLHGVLELKNIRIHPEVRGRKFASFMLRQAETEFPSDLIVVDTRRDQTDMVKFLISEGYVPVASPMLYEEGKEDVVFAKFPRDKSKLFPNLKTYFQSRGF